MKTNGDKMATGVNSLVLKMISELEESEETKKALEEIFASELFHANAGNVRKNKNVRCREIIQKRMPQ